MLLALMAYKS